MDWDLLGRLAMMGMILGGGVLFIVINLKTPSKD